MSEFIDIAGHPLVLPISLTLLLGAAAYLLSRVAPRACGVVALLAAATVVLCGLYVMQYPMAAQEAQGKEASWVWVQLSKDVQLTVDLAWRPLGMVVLFGSAGFAFLIGVYSLRSMAGEYWEGKYYAYMIWALAGACVVALADNLLVLLVGWELVTLMLFLLVNQGRRDAKTGGAKAYGLLGFSDGCLLLAIVLLIAACGTSAALSLSAGPADVGKIGQANGMQGIGYVIYALILVAALAKAGAIPLHTWIPAISEKAPASVMAYLPASMDKLLGIYLLYMLAFRLFRPDWTMQVILMCIGAVTILAAVLMAMMQHNLKRLLAFHAVSQVGYMVLGLGTGTVVGVVGGLLHMINNAIYKSNLFLMSGAVGRAAGSDEIEDMGGLARALPVTFASGTVAALAISGVPPFNGFVSKWLIYQGTLEVGSRGLASALLVVAVFGSALTLASFIKVLYSAFLSPAPKRATFHPTRIRESFFLAAPMVVLAAACIVLGLWPQLITHRVLIPAIAGAEMSGQSLAAEGMAMDVGTLGLWNPTQATGLVVIGIILGLAFRWVMTRPAKVRVVRPFLAGEVPSASDDRFRLPGTGFYETVAKLPVLGGLLKHGQAGAMDVYYWAGKHGGTLVEVLRGWHTGLINLYVAWVLLGLTVTLVYLLLSLGT
ncbi:MAG TPA: complex I subunit 5 family protein [Phycisphaerae bacterium]|nr:complex I subunit 5 family protein [Phycisphaerae bacterium]HUT60914.1 complex I subunit 5 family protein [Phycisphaerae bacterium]